MSRDTYSVSDVTVTRRNSVAVAVVLVGTWAAHALQYSRTVPTGSVAHRMCGDIFVSSCVE